MQQNGAKKNILADDNKKKKTTRNKNVQILLTGIILFLFAYIDTV